MEQTRSKKVGILALQGDFGAHRRMLETCDADITIAEVRDESTFEGCDGLIIPGGESTTMSTLCDRYGLWEPLRARIAAGMPVLGTCAGIIMLAQEISGASQNLPQKTLQALDITVARNAYGRQIESFEATIRTSMQLGEIPLHVVFIRAPQITRVGDAVQVLATYNGQPVAVQQDRIIGATFHPEMTGDRALHRYWLELLP